MARSRPQLMKELLCYRITTHKLQQIHACDTKQHMEYTVRLQHSILQYSSSCIVKAQCKWERSFASRVGRWKRPGSRWRPSPRSVLVGCVMVRNPACGLRHDHVIVISAEEFSPLLTLWTCFVGTWVFLFCRNSEHGLAKGTVPKPPPKMVLSEDREARCLIAELFQSLAWAQWWTLRRGTWCPTLNIFAELSHRYLVTCLPNNLRGVE